MTEFNTSEQGQNPSTILVQIAGLLVLLGGLYSAAQVVMRGWDLLEKPAAIVPFAEEIERQTQLNKFVGQFNLMFEFFRKANSALPAGTQGSGAGGSIYDPVPFPSKQSPTKVEPAIEPAPVAPNASYFVAWIITLILLALIARISLWAVTEGGKLVVFTGNQDRHFKRVLRELAAEIRRPNSLV